MTGMSRFAAICLALAAMLGLAAPQTSRAQQRPPLVEQMAKTYGLNSFGKIEGIRYTFEVKRPDRKTSRSWEWNPKTDTVSYQGTDKQGKAVKVTYRRSQLGSQSDLVKTEIDPAFINDQYWLLLPLHAVWDGSATVTDDGKQPLPALAGSGTAERIVMKYPSQGGYAPGDTWELYVGADKRIKAMVYRSGGSKKRTVVTATWAGYKTAGPLLIATEHDATADDRSARILFTNVAVKLAGSNDWIPAK